VQEEERQWLNLPSLPPTACRAATSFQAAGPCGGGNSKANAHQHAQRHPSFTGNASGPSLQCRTKCLKEGLGVL